MDVVESDVRLLAVAPALVLRLTELAGPGGLGRRPLGHSPVVPIGLLPSLAFLTA